MSRPSRTLACGAIGPYDRDQVLAIARGLEGESAIVHEGQGSILVMDREPIRWEANGRCGLAWSERVDEISGAGIANWRDASCAAAACGLVLEGQRIHLHSSVAGVAPIYYLAHEEAIYFATTIDALALATPRRLSVDWEAWATILSISYPLGDRTPFSEIRRLPPFSTLEVQRGSPRVEEERWPWAEVEPSLSVEAGAGDVVESLRASFARLPQGPIMCQLSGGLDSRLCLGLLSEHRRDDVSALTVDRDTGTDHDIRIAAEIAKTVGVPHLTVAGEPADYWTDLELRALRVDHQFVRPPWRMPELAPLRQAGGVALDGFGFDTLSTPGDRVFTAESVDPRGDDAVVERLWEFAGGQQKRGTPEILGESLGPALRSSAYRQFMAESEPFSGHPARSVLTFFRTRQVRGISMTAYAVLGADVAMAMPLIDDAVARAVLAISPLKKRGGHLYHAAFELIDPRLNDMGTTRRGTAPAAQPTPRRNRSAALSDAVHASITDGPLAPWIRPRTLRRLTRHHRGREPRTERGALAVVMFHEWCRRYRHVLGEIDAADGFGVRRPE